MRYLSLFYLWYFYLKISLDKDVEIFFVLETILGPVWVWLVIHEQPTNKTIIGGVFIIIIIFIHTFLELRENKKVEHN